MSAQSNVLKFPTANAGSVLVLRMLNPTHGETVAQLCRMSYSLDYDHFAGRLSLPAETDIANWDRPAGSISFGSRSTSTTFTEATVAGVVWFTDGSGTRHVRVAADRLMVSRWEPRSIFDFPSTPPATLYDHVTNIYLDVVMPEPHIGRIPADTPALLVQLCQDVHAAPLSLANWSALADWYRDDEDDRRADLCLASIASLRSHFTPEELQP